MAILADYSCLLRRPQTELLRHWHLLAFVLPAPIRRSRGIASALHKPFPAAPSGSGLAVRTPLLQSICIVIFRPLHCFMQGGNYGAQRMYGAIGWGSMSLVAGVVISHYGIYAGFACYTVVAVAAVVPLLLLPMDALQSKEAQSQLTARPTAAIAIAGGSSAPTFLRVIDMLGAGSKAAAYTLLARLLHDSIVHLLHFLSPSPCHRFLIYRVETSEAYLHGLR